MQNTQDKPEIWYVETEKKHSCKKNCGVPQGELDGQSHAYILFNNSSIWIIASKIDITAGGMKKKILQAYPKLNTAPLNRIRIRQKHDGYSNNFIIKK